MLKRGLEAGIVESQNGLGWHKEVCFVFWVKWENPVRGVYEFLENMWVEDNEVWKHCPGRDRNVQVLLISRAWIYMCSDSSLYHEGFPLLLWEQEQHLWTSPSRGT